MMGAFVRVSGRPNTNFLVGYPGISATLVSPAVQAAPQNARADMRSLESKGLSNYVPGPAYPVLSTSPS